MTAFHRWCLVAVGVILLVTVPLMVRAWPVPDQSIGAQALMTRVRAAEAAPYSGRVQTEGNLDLPVASHFTDVGALFGGTTNLRVWWRSSDSWRVDKVLPTGETDLVHDATVTAQWQYESASATFSHDPDIRLPRTADLLPPALGKRLLTDVNAKDLSRLPARRVAGRDTLGLRLSPRAGQSSIDHVDLWADARTSVPLLVEVYAKGVSTPAFTSQFQQFSSAMPSTAETSFVPPAGAKVSVDNVLDIADEANQYAPVFAPTSLAGLARISKVEGAVGVYGKGVTQMIAIPLWSHAADPLREQLEATPGIKKLAAGDYLSDAPLGVLLTGSGRDRHSWLIAGTVTRQTLVTAGKQITRLRNDASYTFVYPPSPS